VVVRQVDDPVGGLRAGAGCRDRPGRRGAPPPRARRPTPRRRPTELQEHELIKLATLSAALADGLRRRGVADPVARLAAETGITVFRVAFERWVGEPEDRGLPRVMRESFDELRALTAADG
jgi:hypothetical protein